MEHNSSSSRADRKTIEKNRRNHMKSLYSQLNSLVPHQTHKEVVVSSLPDQLDKAAKYIKYLQIKLEKMREKKESLMANNDQRDNTASSSSEAMTRCRLPRIDLCESGSVLKVVLITGLDQHNFLFRETVRIIHEEGADVVNVTYSLVDNTVFHTIHAKVGETNYSGFGASSISERLHKLVNVGCY